MNEFSLFSNIKDAIRQKSDFALDGYGNVDVYMYYHVRGFYTMPAKMESREARQAVRITLTFPSF